jgi:hypothetical protein
MGLGVLFLNFDHFPCKRSQFWLGLRKRNTSMASGTHITAHIFPFFLGLFGWRSLQFLRFGETPLLFKYFEICHYNSSSTWHNCICTHTFCIVPSSLADIWTPHVSSFFNLRPSRRDPWRQAAATRSAWRPTRSSRLVAALPPLSRARRAGAAIASLRSQRHPFAQKHTRWAAFSRQPPSPVGFGRFALARWLGITCGKSHSCQVFLAGFLSHSSVRFE